MTKTALLTFALLLNTGLLIPKALAAGDAEAGGLQFKRLCGSCHYIGKNARSGFGPQLNGIFGRHAGSTTDFQYSDAMKSSSVVWNDDTLTAYIKDPSAVVPGTRMSFWGLSDPEKIANLLAYLRTFQP